MIINQTDETEDLTHEQDRTQDKIDQTPEGSPGRDNESEERSNSNDKEAKNPHLAPMPGLIQKGALESNEHLRTSGDSPRQNSSLALASPSSQKLRSTSRSTNQYVAAREHLLDDIVPREDYEAKPNCLFRTCCCFYYLCCCWYCCEKSKSVTK